MPRPTVGYYLDLKQRPFVSERKKKPIEARVKFGARRYTVLPPDRISYNARPLLTPDQVATASKEDVVDAAGVPALRVRKDATIIVIKVPKWLHLRMAREHRTLPRK